MTKATTGQRVGAFLLDFLFSFPLALIWMIPFIGTIVGGFLLFLYWLFRDVMRPSLGKKIVGLDVAALNYGPPSTGSLILRNLLLALPTLIAMIPLVGVVGFGLDLFVILVEFILLISTGIRLGDRMASTIVVERSKT